MLCSQFLAIVSHGNYDDVIGKKQAVRDGLTRYLWKTSDELLDPQNSINRAEPNQQHHQSNNYNPDKFVANNLAS